MSEARKPLEQVFDLFVYAPLGLLLNADEVIPNLVERGRQQVTMARMFGKFAVKQGQTEAGKAAAKLQEQATEVVGLLAGRSIPPSVPSASGPVTPPTPAPPTAASVAGPSVRAPGVATLAVPDYDSLSASQVVPRLEGLSATELDAVRAYEAANRGRKTILSKIAALQG
ncbi:MAG: hypothetical protein ABIV94_04670 [Acidimicrobiales bacterium]